MDSNQNAQPVSASGEAPPAEAGPSPSSPVDSVVALFDEFEGVVQAALTEADAGILSAAETLASGAPIEDAGEGPTIRSCTHHDHVLKRPDAYVGATEPIPTERVVAVTVGDPGV